VNLLRDNGGNATHDTTLIRADTRTSDLETLGELNRSYIRSVRVSDVRWFDENLAEDFLNSNADGSLVDRAGFLAQMARPCPVSDFDVEDARIRLLGDHAIVHGRTTYKKGDGQAGAGRYTDVWSRRQGRWLCVSAHVARG
jgi:ketosteroid isomerase-like protein